MTTPTQLTIPARQADVLADADVVVCGGGPAGLGAALGAAREGASVVLIERYGFLGGNLTAAAVGTVCGLYVRTGAGSFDNAIGGLAKTFADRLVGAGSAIGPFPFKQTAVLLYVPWAAKRLADQLVQDADVTLLLHSLVSDVIVDDGRITGIVLATKQGPKVVTGKVFIDTTGDGDVAAAAGVPWEMSPAGLRQFGSMQFFMQHVDVEAAVGAGLDALSTAIADHGQHLSRDGGAAIPTFRPGEMIGAMTRITRNGAPLDATDPVDLTYGELEGRRRAEEAAEFLKAHMPGFEDAFLADTAVQQGVRESRRIVGAYELRGSDVTGLARFDDAVAACAWPQEYHVEGRGTRYEFLPDSGAYQIPYRVLVPQGPANLLVAGRCVSAEPDALASCRVMAPCMALGEAAGTAARVAIEGDAAAAVSQVDVGDVQDRLVGHGAVLGV